MPDGQLPGVRGYTRFYGRQEANFGVQAPYWTEAATERGGGPWHAGVMKGAARFMGVWHKHEETKSRN